MSNIFTEQETARNKINHLINVFKESECEIRPNFFVTGPSGSGKSYLIREATDLAEIGYVEVNAAQLTREGTSGNSLSRALVPLKDHHNTPVVVFVDEFDKLLVSSNGQTHDHHNGVQDELLKIVESDQATIFGDYGKYNNIDTKNVMYVFAGAFHGANINSIDDLAKYGLRPEFLGRIPLHVHVDKVGLESLLNAVPRSRLLKQYLRLFPDTDVKIAVGTIQDQIKAGYKKSPIGIRQIESLVHQYFMAI